MKEIRVLLTQHKDPLSRVLRLLTRCHYTHASIGFDDDYREYYSFNTRKGFCVEDLEKKRSDAPCILYQFAVEDEAYDRLVNKVEEFKQTEDYRYSYIGLILCLLRIPHKFSRSYFCSQFVSELILMSGKITIYRSTSIYLPKHFIKDLGKYHFFSGTTKQVLLLK